MSEAEEHAVNSAGSPIWFTVTRQDYALAKASLNDIVEQKASMNRIMATFMMGGGRQQWGAVVELFEDSAKHIGCAAEDIKIIYVYEDQSATATIEELRETGGVH